MACKHCGSANVRLSEPGILANTLYCNDCKKSFEKMSPGAGLQLGAILLSALTGGILGDVFTDMNDGGGSGNA